MLVKQAPYELLVNFKDDVGVYDMMRADDKL